jgi:hypothetical protein
MTRMGDGMPRLPYGEVAWQVDSSRPRGWEGEAKSGTSQTIGKS